MPRSMWDLSYQPGIEPMPPAVQGERLNHWTTSEVLILHYFKYIFSLRYFILCLCYLFFVFFFHYHHHGIPQVFKVLVAQLCLTFCDPMDCSLPGSSVYGDSPTRILKWVAMPSSRGSFQPRDQTRSPVLQADSLPAEVPGKPYLWE